MNVYPNWVVRSTICHGVMQCSDVKFSNDKYDKEINHKHRCFL